MREVVVRGHVVVHADHLDERVDSRGLDPLLGHKRRVLQRQRRQVAESVVVLAEDGEVDVVEVEEAGRVAVAARQLDDAEYLRLLYPLPLHLVQE